MTTDQDINNTIKQERSGPPLTVTKAASTICLLAGIWLFISPWVYGNVMTASSWNCWIVGAFIILWAVIRVSRPAYSTLLSYCSMFCGIWVFFSPWIYGYAGTHTGRFINSLCVGVIVVAFAIISARASGAWSAAPRAPYVASQEKPGPSR